MARQSVQASYYEIMKRLWQWDTWLYGLQHLIFGVANAAAVPVVVGSALGLSAAEIGALAQRTFFFSGIASLIQAFLGHRYPIFEGPGGIWYTTFIVLGDMAVQTNMPLKLLRTDIMTGMFTVGVIYILIGFMGLMPLIRKLFTPLVNSIFLIVMALQFSSTLAHGLIVAENGRSVLGLDKLVVFFVAIGTILLLSLKTKGFVKNTAVLIGTVVGWVAAYAVGVAAPLQDNLSLSQHFVALPHLLAWGRPTFDLGVTMTLIMGGLVVLSNLIASVAGMDELYFRSSDTSVFNKTIISTGVADLLAAVGSVVAFIPYASSIGFAALTGVLDVMPFIVGSVILVVLGMIPAVGSFFAALPITVGYAVMFSVFIMITGMGVKTAVQDGMDNRKIIILGFSVLIGNGISFLPAGAFAMVPAGFTYLLANGLIMSVLIALILEHIIFPDKSDKTLFNDQQEI